MTCPYACQGGRRRFKESSNADTIQCVCWEFSRDMLIMWVSMVVTVCEPV